MVLQTDNLTKSFGGLVAVDDVSLRIDDEIVGLMGPNGSGKSTFINCITGIHDPSAGRVHHDERDVTDLAPHQKARDGMGRTFQTPRIFAELTVRENVMIPLLRTDADVADVTAKAERLIELVDLTHVIEQEAKGLSGGQKKLLEFARCLMRDPDVIFMDEPFAGVHPDLKSVMIDQIDARRADGVDFLIVSHEVKSLYDISDRIDVFDRGELIASGAPAMVQDDQRVVDAYLGGMSSA
jgi:branched-chain amino acid transport system ATP-binding protein